MRRRQLVGAAASAALIAAVSKPALAARRAPFVTSDVSRLRRVMVHRVQPTSYPVSFAMGEFPFDSVTVPEEAVRAHEAMEQRLSQAGAEVVQLRTLLEESIAAARRRGAFDAWLRATHPRLAPRAKDVTAAWLLGEAPEVQYQSDADGNYRHFVDSFLSGTFVRDMGVMTPRGLIVCNFYGPWRRPQARLLRLVADFSPSMADYPVVFDGAEENMLLEGGDLQVLDEQTLLVGTGNRTDPRVARSLARRLEMDVIAVQLRKVDSLRFAPGDGGYTDALRGLFLHLDTCLTLVSDKRALALPYFLETQYAGKDPLTNFWKGAYGEATMDEAKIKAVIEYLPEIGRIRRYAAGSGVEDESVKDQKIVDWLRGRGYEVTFVGEPLPSKPNLPHFFRMVLAEHEQQAANVVAVAPGRVVGYEGSPRTRAALEASGITVETFPGRELARWNGGPHCLTLPLERG